MKRRTHTEMVQRRAASWVRMCADVPGGLAFPGKLALFTLFPHPAVCFAGKVAPESLTASSNYPQCDVATTHFRKHTHTHTELCTGPFALDKFINPSTSRRPLISSPVPVLLPPHPGGGERLPTVSVRHAKRPLKFSLYWLQAELYMHLEIAGYVHKGGDESKTAKVRGAM